MDKEKISIQLYTTRKFQPYHDVLNFFSKSGVRNIELFGLETIKIEDFSKLLNNFNITSESSHCDFDALDDTSDIINRAKALNIKHVIIPAPSSKGKKSFEEQFLMSEEEWNDFGKSLSSYVPIFEDSGLTLGYHNHSYEFVPLESGKLPIECILYHNKNLKFEMDLGWAIAGGADPEPWIEKYAERIIACHLKDFFNKDSDLLEHNSQSPVGDGFIDWKKILNSIKKTECNLFILEHDDPADYKKYTLKSIENLTKI